MVKLPSPVLFFLRFPLDFLACRRGLGKHGIFRVARGSQHTGGQVCGLMVRDGAARLLTMRVNYRFTCSDLILRSPLQAGVSKDALRPGHKAACSARESRPSCASMCPSKAKRAQGMPGASASTHGPACDLERAHERSHHR